MAKVAVSTCDRCGSWDTDQCPVRRVNVTGPAFDLCRTCRIGLLLTVGVPEPPARRYHELADERGARRGTTPSLKSLLHEDVTVAGALAEVGDPNVPPVAEGITVQVDPDGTVTVLEDQPELPLDTLEEQDAKADLVPASVPATAVDAPPEGDDTGERDQAVRKPTRRR